MSPLVSVLYICDACRKIRQLDISADKLETEGDLYKIKDVHTDHETILYLNSNYGLERITNDPPAPPLDHPIVLGQALIESEEEETTELFTGANKIYVPASDPKRIPVQVELHKLIVLNMNGVNTLGDLYKGLNPDWSELTPEYLLTLIRNLEVRGWIKEKTD